MCYSYASSITAFTIAAVSCVLLWLRNSGTDRWSALFILGFSLTQLLEAGIWKHLYDQRATQLLTSNILLVQWAYPLMNAYIGWNLTGSKTMYYISILTFIALLNACYRVISAYPGQITSIIDSNQNIEWIDKEKEGLVLGDHQLILGLLWLSAAILPLYYMDNTWFLVPFFAATFLYSKLLNPEYQGSLWCYYSTYLGHALLLL